MTDTQAATLNTLLGAALELPHEQREAWLEALGPEFESVKPRLRAILARALREDRRSLSTLPKLGGITTQSGTDDGGLRVGADLNHYRLVRKLGSGGMGVVWLARDRGAPDQRNVALKFAHNRSLRSGLAARLAREQSLLAALEHPNIARLYGSGMTRTGHLYLVLEYIEGEPLDRYCERHDVGLAQRFALFVQIADALTHAHERGIVHRDLKPSNVLVTSDRETRLLDFGLAKLLHGPMTARDLQLSVMSGRPLTPEYASPEQLLEGEIGFASDIYSLAVMLYEQATGARPYPCKRGGNRALRDAILANPPPAPSELAADAGARDQLRGAIDALLLKALAKRPEQRQASMREFAAELEAQARVLTRRHFADSPQPMAAGDSPQPTAASDER